MVFSELYQFVQTSNDETLQKTGLKKSDVTECAEIIRQAFASDKMDEREGLIMMGQKTMATNYKD